jgi:hypothetical protein
MFAQDLICGFMKLGLKNRFVFKKRRCLEHPRIPLLPKGLILQVAGFIFNQGATFKIRDKSRKSTKGFARPKFRVFAGARGVTFRC